MLRPVISHLSLAGLGAGLLFTAPLPQTATEAPGLMPGLDAGAWADFDGDGLEDLFAIHAAGSVALLRNLGGGRFEPCEDRAGLQDLSAIRSASWRDFDVDSDPDLFVVGVDGSVRLLRNDDASFVDATAELGLRETVGVLRAHWTDFDSDGLDDLVLTLSDGYRFLQNAGATFVERSSIDALPGGVSVVGASPAGSALAAAGAGLAPSDAPGAADPDAVRGAPGSTEISISRIQRAPGAVNGTSSGYCADGIVNQGGTHGTCIQASNVPTLGMLFPMDFRLNVDSATGNVGMGTLGPTAQLHVVSSVVKPAIRAYSDAFTSGMFYSASALPAVWMESTGTGLGAFVKPRLGVGGSILGQPVARVELGLDSANAGEIQVENASGIRSVWIQSAEASDGAQLTMTNAAGIRTAELDAEAGGRGGEFKLFNQAGAEMIELSAEEVAGNGAQIVLRKADGTASIILDAEQGGDGRITTQELQITGGADLVEHFETSCGRLEPGTVLVIDADNAGQLCASDEAYDRKVAGVISGAGGVKPGIFLGQHGMIEGDTPVALTGRVYVRCSAENGAVRPGDLLTTASLAGHAMRATDSARSNGAVIGKAMSSLEEGTGLVLVLVNLQ